MDVSKLFEPSKIRRLSKDETIALYKRHLMAQYERAEAAEARCARLQQALREILMAEPDDPPEGKPTAWPSFAGRLQALAAEALAEPDGGES